MNKRTARKLQRKKNEKIELLFMVIGLLGFIFFIYVESKYKDTIIEFRRLPIIYTLTGLIFEILTYKIKEKIMGKAFNPFKHFVLAIFTYGSICCGLFFFLNSHFFTSNNYIIKLQIEEKHESYRHSSQYVTVYISGLEKDIQFPNVEWNAIKDANYVLLTLRNGLFHIPVINEQKLSIH